MPKFILHDLAYSFNKDNPFPDDGNKQRLNILRKIVENDLSVNFDEIDREINYYNLKENLQQLYGDETTEKDITEITMIDDIKDVVEKLPQLKYFNSWCQDIPRVGKIIGGNVPQEPPQNTAATTEPQSGPLPASSTPTITLTLSL